MYSAPDSKVGARARTAHTMARAHTACIHLLPYDTQMERERLLQYDQRLRLGKRDSDVLQYKNAGVRSV